MSRTAYRTPIFLIFIVTSLWLLVPQTQIGLIEEWSYYKSFALSSPSDVQFGFANRPLLLPIFYFAYCLTPNSFFGLHFLLILVFVLKTILVYQIVRILTREQDIVSVPLTLLIVFYPSNDALLSLRIFAYHVSITAYLVAVYLLLRYWHCRRDRYLLIMALAQVNALLIVEVTLPMMLITPIALLELRHSNISGRLPSKIWYSVPVLFTGWYLILYMQGLLSYQQIIASSQTSNSSFRNYFFPILRAYKHTLLDSWLQIDFDVQWIPVMSLLVLVLIILCSIRVSGQTLNGNIHAPILYVGIGLALILIGFLPFSLTAHRYSNEYSFIVSMIGATLVVVYSVKWASQRTRYSKVLYLSVVGVLIYSSLMHAYHQLSTLTRQSQLQAKILSGFVHVIPAIPDDVLLLVFDNADMIQDNWMFGLPFGNVHFTDAIRYVYGNPEINVFICYDGLAYMTPCKLHADAVYVSSVALNKNIFPYTNIVGVEISRTYDINILDSLPVVGHPEGYNPDANILATRSPTSLSEFNR